MVGKTKLVLFGAGQNARRFWYSMTHDSPYEVIAFCVDAPYVGDGSLQGLPVVDFATVEKRFPPGEHEMMLAIGATAVNALRARRFGEAQRKGYRLASYIASRAITSPDLQWGDSCVIFEAAALSPFVTLGQNVVIGMGAALSHDTVVGDHCYIGSGAVIGGNVEIGERCFVGLNATVRDNVHVGEGCLIGAGAVVVSDTEPDGVYVGVPARRTSTPASQMRNI